MRLSRAVLLRATLIALAVAAALWIARAGSLRGVSVVHAEDRAAMRFAPQQAPTAPTIQVYSRETLVDVTVTDDAGQPVLGLKQTDFTVEEDGKPQPIRAFAEFDKPVPIASVPAAAAPKLSPNVYSNRSVGSAAGPLNVILFGNITWSECVYATRAARAYVGSMPAGTQVALFVDGRLLQGFTTDPEVLTAALNADPALKNCLLPQQPEIQMSAMRAVAAYVAGGKGKKDLIWFTHGIPSVTDPVFAGNLRTRAPDPTPELHRTYGLLAAAQVTVDPVDASSIVVPGIGSVAGPLKKIDANTGAAEASANMAALVGIGANHLSLESVAEVTGGEAFYNTNDLRGAVARAIDGGTSYYTVSYVPPGKTYDGRHHTIRVRVNRPGVHLAYRDEYYAEDPGQIGNEPVPGKLAATTPEQKKDTMKASMARFGPVAAQVVFDVKLTPAESAPRPVNARVMGFPVDELKDKPMARYDILYSISADEIALSDGPDGVYRGSLEFDVVASDVSGRLMTSVSRTIPLALSVDEYADFVQTPFQFFQQIDLPAGSVFVRVGILDKVSNKVGTMEIPVTVAKPVHTATK